MTTHSNDKVLQQLGAETMLWSSSQKRSASPADVVGSKVVLLYFSAHWCGPCRRFTPVLIDFYKKLKSRAGTEDFEVIFCSMDKVEPEYTSYSNSMPWWSLPFESPHMGNLANVYGAQGIPHLVVLDKDGTVINSDALGEVSVDPEGEKFPWRPRKIIEILPEQYLGSDKVLHPMAELDSKYLMFYFSAHWCPPCRGFTPTLSKAYTALKKQRSDFELLFVSSDHDHRGFDEYFSEMTFGAIPYGERQVKADLASKLQIRGIPALLIFGPRPADGGDRPLINGKVRGIIERGDYLSEFPYQPKPYGDLNTTSDDINVHRCVIVFHEGGDDEEQEDVQEAIEMAGENCSDKQVRFFWANSPDGLTKVVREALKLGPISDKPTLVLLDIPDRGGFYVSSSDEISLDSIMSFLAAPGERRQI